MITQTRSLSLRQGFGILSIVLGLGLLFTCLLSGMIIIFLIKIGKFDYHGIPTIVGVAIGLFICSFPGLVLLLAGLWLLRDPNGIYIKFLKN